MRLTDQDKSAIEDAVKKAERETSGEIVFAVSEASGRYRHAILHLCLAAMVAGSAGYLLAPVPHKIGILLWVQLISFTVIYAIAPFVSWSRWFIPDKEMEQRVHEAAFREFYASGLYRTRESNGVLIYLSNFERRVVVIADKGIHERMGTTHWNGVRDRIIQGIRLGQAREGICAAVGECGRGLSEHFPVRADDANELPDRVIDRTARPLTDR